MENMIEEPAVAYPHRYTPEEYLAMEWENGVRYEYWEGELVAMSGGTKAHGLIADNTNAFFRNRLKAKKCMSFQENIHLKIKEKDIYFLPDVVVTCDKKDLDFGERTVQNPVLVAEVLSESTELYDRSEKWNQYHRIKSLRYFLLVSQHRYQVEIYSRPHEQALFSYQWFDEIEQSIPFPDLGFEMTMREVYDGIAFPSEFQGQKEGDSPNSIPTNI